MTLDEINRLRALKSKDDGIAFDLEVLKVADELLDAAERAERAEKERDTLRDEVLAWRMMQGLVDRAHEPIPDDRAVSASEWEAVSRNIKNARAATDAAGILKGAGT